MLLQIFIKKVYALKLICGILGDTSSRFKKGSLHCLIQFYLSMKESGRDEVGADFLTTLCALYSFINALYVELVRKIIILRGGGGGGEEESWWFMVDKLISLVSVFLLPNETGVRGLPFFSFFFPFFC